MGHKAVEKETISVIQTVNDRCERGGLAPTEGRTVSQTGGGAQGRHKELLPSGRMQILVWLGRKRVRREAGETGRTPSLKVLLLCSEDWTPS